MQFGGCSRHINVSRPGMKHVDNIKLLLEQPYVATVVIWMGLCDVIPADSAVERQIVGRRR
jgi:hypothetical protein